jgi:methyltransferase (TIGR00027 family)
MATKRIETTTSRTAEWTCLSRALSSLEKNECYRSEDALALQLLPNWVKVSIRIPLMRSMFIKVAAAKGMYEYVIARTKYIDSVFKECLEKKFDQILIFGAGFDTRALRFKDRVGMTKIYELDAPSTQQAKIGQYQKRGLSIPSNVTFVSIDFDKDSLPGKLAEAGLQKDRRTLFVLEGLLMYLQPESVHETFQTIRDFAGQGSEVVFDYVYASVLRGEGRYEDEKKVVESVARAGEEWHFGIEEGQAAQFLSAYGFRLCEELNAGQLEKLYFTDTAGEIVGHINGTHCLVRAAKR